MSGPPTYRTRWTRAIRGSDLHATTKLVAYTLATWMDTAGHCWPSLAAITKGAGLKDRSTVCRHLKKLGDAGFVRRDRGGPGHSTRYQAVVAGGPLHGGWSSTSGGGSRATGLVADEPHEVSSRSKQLKYPYKDQREWKEQPNPEPQLRNGEKQCTDCGGWTKHRAWCGAETKSLKLQRVEPGKAATPC